MTSLNKLLAEAQGIEQALIESGGEITAELAELMKINEKNLSQKVESYAFLMARLEKLAEFYNEKADFFLRIKKTCENLRTSLKDNMQVHMHLFGITEAKGQDVRFVLSKAQPKLIITDVEAIPATYKTVVTTLDIEKAALKDALKAGAEIRGAKLEDSYSLRQYPIKPRDLGT